MKRPEFSEVIKKAVQLVNLTMRNPLQDENAEPVELYRFTGVEEAINNSVRDLNDPDLTINGILEKPDGSRMLWPLEKIVERLEKWPDWENPPAN